MSDTARSSAEDILPPVIGNLTRQSPQSILTALERTAFSGELRFTIGEKVQLVAVVAGHPQLSNESQSLLERFLAAKSGNYELREQIPVPPKGARSTPLRVYGSLHDLSPSELLRYCESVGLSGKLEMRSGDDLCVARYSKGELETLAIDGKDDTAIDVVFGWSEGKWSVAQKSMFDEDAPSAVIDVRNELGTIELALSALLARGEKNHPEVAPPTTIAGHFHSNADTSVKIIFRAPKLEQSPATRHSSTNVDKEVVSLDPSNRATTMSDEQAERIIAKSKIPSVRPAPVAEQMPAPRADPAVGSSAERVEQRSAEAEPKSPASAGASERIAPKSAEDNRGRLLSIVLITVLVFSSSTILIALVGLLR